MAILIQAPAVQAFISFTHQQEWSIYRMCARDCLFHINDHLLLEFVWKDWATLCSAADDGSKMIVMFPVSWLLLYTRSHKIICMAQPMYYSTASLLWHIFTLWQWNINSHILIMHILYWHWHPPAPSYLWGKASWNHIFGCIVPAPIRTTIFTSFFPALWMIAAPDLHIL